jgi:hypothetical protein
MGRKGNEKIRGSGRQGIRRPGDHVQKLILHLTDNVKNGIKSFLKVSVDQFS